MIRNKLILFISMVSIAVLSVGVLIACSDDDDESFVRSYGDDKRDNQDDLNKVACNFEKSSNVWEYNTGWFGVKYVYTWTNETTVRYETWMNQYHMDEDDEILEEQNRDSLYEEVMNDCLYYLERQNDSENGI